MKKLLILAIATCLGICVNSQSALKQLRPEISPLPDLSESAQKAIERRDQLLNKSSLSEKETEELNKLLESYGEVTESVWDILGHECSWYCGGGPYKIKASSQLDSNYKADYAHDLSFLHAWVEGAKGNGIGEWIEYSFLNNIPRINTINIYNGLVKNESSWEKNGRVKKLKLWVNGKPFAILHLDDVRDGQSFQVPLLGKRADKKDLILRFEILEVYPGTKFKDTVLTEIYFDGIDVH